MCNYVIFTEKQDQYVTLSFLWIGKVASILYHERTIFYGILLQVEHGRKRGAMAIS